MIATLILSLSCCLIDSSLLLFLTLFRYCVYQPVDHCDIIGTNNNMLCVCINVLVPMMSLLLL